jgi:hypothetical protein
MDHPKRQHVINRDAGIAVGTLHLPVKNNPPNSSHTTRELKLDLHVASNAEAQQQAASAFC